jgi:hypothetical protein
MKIKNKVVSFIGEDPSKPLGNKCLIEGKIIDGKVIVEVLNSPYTRYEVHIEELCPGKKEIEKLNKLNLK